jgi:hypothetical protein
MVLQHQAHQLIPTPLAQHVADGVLSGCFWLDFAIKCLLFAIFPAATPWQLPGWWASLLAWGSQPSPSQQTTKVWLPGGGPVLVYLSGPLGADNSGVPVLLQLQSMGSHLLPKAFVLILLFCLMHVVLSGNALSICCPTAAHW